MPSLPLPLIRSAQRKTLAIVANRQGELSIRAPKRLPLSVIERFVASQTAWIENHQATHRPIPLPTFTHASTLLLYGEPVPVLHTPSGTTSLWFEDGAFHLVARNHARARALFLRWYRTEALRVVRERVAHFASQMGVTPNGITITNAHSMWGSCSATNALRFSWRLLMAPPEVLDYVVIHELAHIRHKHHKPSFWNVVHLHNPNTPAHRAWLHKHGTRLVL